MKQLAKIFPNPICFIEDTQMDIPFRKSSWNWDDKYQTDFGDGTPDIIISNAETGRTVNINRCFKSRNEGILAFELQIVIKYDNGGTYFKFTNKKGEDSFMLISKGGYLYAGESKIDVKFENSVDGTFALGVRMDLDKRMADVCVNGVYGGSFPMKNAPVEKFEMGIAESGVGGFVKQWVKMVSDYPVNEVFMTSPTNRLPYDWEFDGDFCVDKKGGTRGFDAYSMKINAKKGTCHKAAKRFEPVCGNVIAECMMLLDKNHSGSYFSLNCGNENVIKVKTEADTFTDGNGKLLRKYLDCVWQSVRIEANTETKSLRIRIDGKICAETTYDTSAEYFDSVTVGFDAEEDALMWFDDVKVYCYTEPEDYVPKPVPAESAGYMVGLNVCPLWREGHHFGWDLISPFPDLEPVIGFYEEGVEETADWEIKFLVEHGVNFQHYCWYSPDDDNPTKNSYLDSSLNKGYLNSKYSDMMSFCIMWENAGNKCRSFEQFEKYVWRYWKEYYFSDSRYMRMDNKAIFTVYNVGFFQNAFGGSEGTQKAIKWMREDIKSLGYDDIIILLCGGHVSSETFFRDVKALGFDGVYAYHWQIAGKDPEHQINRMKTIESYNTTYMFPTISSGFNNIGWSDVRKPLISVEGSERVAQFIRDEFLPKYDKDSWKSKVVLLSNWNEYGEGTYLMPAGVHGFGYLETVRKYFTNSANIPHEDVVPTASQKARITNMYCQERTLIKAWDYEEPEKQTVKILANGYDVTLRFNPVFKNGEIYIPCEPKSGLLRKLCLCYEYSRFTGELKIMSKDSTVVFTNNTNKALANQEQYTLSEKVTVRDGIPVIPLIFLMEKLGYYYCVNQDNTVIKLYSYEKKHRDIIDAREKGFWQWLVPHDKEGWGSKWVNLVDDEKATGGYAITGCVFGDTSITSGTINISTKEFHKIKMRLKYKLAEEKTSIKLCFASPFQRDMGRAEQYVWEFGKNSSDGEYVEVEISLEALPKLRKTISEMKLDFGAGSEYYIDYIKFIKNPAYNPCEDEPGDAVIYNGTADDAADITFSDWSSVITVVKDPDDENNNVFSVKPSTYASTVHANHRVEYSKDVTYVAECDVRIISDKPAGIILSVIYDDQGRDQHKICSVTGTYEDGWLHCKGEFAIGKSPDRTKDMFSIYSTPVDDVATGYYLDNVKLYIKKN